MCQSSKKKKRKKMSVRKCIIHINFVRYFYFFLNHLQMFFYFSVILFHLISNKFVCFLLKKSQPLQKIASKFKKNTCFYGGKKTVQDSSKKKTKSNKMRISRFSSSAFGLV